jgi:pimeloyl-ACP methyl ester carboxylesterase
MTPLDPWLEHYGERRRVPRGASGRRIALGLAVFALVLAGVLAGVARRDGGWRPPSGVGGFDACTYGGRVAARCIDLRVPEDASRPSGRSIALHVAILPATRRPARGALFYLEGGPGGAASTAAVKVDEVFAKVGEYRDIVLVDQRGTGGSHALACPRERVPVSDAAAVAAYVRRCLARFGGEARLFTSEAAAEDIERVRQALGYGRIDVYGGSYGATLAQWYLRLHPGSVRTATLDGGSLGSTRVYELAARNAELALRATIARCHARRSACLRAFAEPRAELDRVLARHPANADRVATTIAALLRTPENAARVPLLIHQAAGGDDEPLAREHAALVGRELGGRARLAMVWTILCGEPWARADVSAATRASRGSFLAHAAVARAKLLRQVCSAVPPVAAAAERARPSAVPVLLLAGSADPLDPPANVRGWRQAFPNGRLVTVPGLAHGVVAHGCLRLLVARFVAAGDARGLDAACAQHVALPPFELP